MSAWVLFGVPGLPVNDDFPRLHGTVPLLPGREALGASLTCALVASGADRLLVLREVELPKDSSRDDLILDLLGGGLPGMGIGQNVIDKVVVVGPGSEALEFTFHFYQVHLETRRVLSRMECASAACSAAAWAMLKGLPPTPAGLFRSVNLATNQIVEMTPLTSAWWNANWRIRFNHLHHLWSAMTLGAKTFRLDHDGTAIDVFIVFHGSIFVMAIVSPDRASEALTSRLSALGDDFGHRAGHPERVTEVIYGLPRAVVGGMLECDAICFSAAQQGCLLSGSAAMAMSAFMTARGYLPVTELDDRRGQTHVRIFHPGGLVTVCVDLIRSGSQWEIDATSFETSLRLLMHGVLIPP